MRLYSLLALAALVPAGCQAAPAEAPEAGYRGIEKISLLAKGME